MPRISSRRAEAIDRSPLIDHPASQPLAFRVCAAPQPVAGERGGIYLRFRAAHPPRAGTPLQLSIEAGGKVHQFHSRVVEVDRAHTPNRVVVRIARQREAFVARMIEQLCHIAHYRQQTLASEGRALSEERAAREWIARYAAAFPALDR